MRVESREQWRGQVTPNYQGTARHMSNLGEALPAFPVLPAFPALLPSLLIPDLSSHHVILCQTPMPPTRQKQDKCSNTKAQFPPKWKERGEKKASKRAE